MRLHEWGTADLLGFWELCEFGLGFVEGDVGDVFLGGGEVDDGLGGRVVAPGADGVEVGDEVLGEAWR